MPLSFNGPQLKQQRLKNPLRVDPTRTGLIRRAFEADIRARFSLLAKEVRQYFSTDVLGLKAPAVPVFHAVPAPRSAAYLTDPGKLQSFMTWLQGQVDQGIFQLATSGKSVWTANYITSAYRRGVLDGMAKGSPSLGDALVQPVLYEQISKVELLGTRTWEGVKGITARMGTELNQILAKGLIDGSAAQEIAREMVGRIDLTYQRALVIARTEIVRAHAEGTLDAFEKLGEDNLGLIAEWKTAGDERVCPQCESHAGKTYTVEEARGLIPLHPNCRCAWTIVKKTKSRRRK